MATWDQVPSGQRSARHEPDLPTRQHRDRHDGPLGAQRQHRARGPPQAALMTEHRRRKPCLDGERAAERQALGHRQRHGVVDAIQLQPAAESPARPRRSVHQGRVVAVARGIDCRHAARLAESVSGDGTVRLRMHACIAPDEGRDACRQTEGEIARPAKTCAADDSVDHLKGSLDVFARVVVLVFTKARATLEWRERDDSAGNRVVAERAGPGIPGQGGTKSRFRVLEA